MLHYDKNYDIVQIITCGINMAVIYKKLFKILIDRKMKKKELCEN